MVNSAPSSFERIIVLDFEFGVRAGDRPDPICLAWQEIGTGETGQLWLDGKVDVEAPFDGGSILFVAYYGVAEMSCFLSLGWPCPANVVDLYAEFRLRTNDGRPRGGRGLLAACEEFGIAVMDSEEKTRMRDVAIKGPPFTRAEREGLLIYCAEDVEATVQLWKAMHDKIDLPRALVRGRYVAALAQIEANGIPIDVGTYGRLRSDWPRFLKELCEDVDKDYGVFDDGRFRSDLWLGYCNYRQIPWPLLDGGKPDLKQATFDSMSGFPEVEAMAKLRWLRSKMRTLNIEVGDDGRSRVMSSPFGTKTSRNAPSSTKFIFGCHPAFRSLIRPSPGSALAYVDYSQQEVLVAAALSGDPNLLAAYRSGDPYIAFAKLAKAVPDDANKVSHPSERALYKRCSLAVQYGMGAPALAEQAGIAEPYARELIEHHKRIFPDFWKFTRRVQNQGALGYPLITPYGWRFEARHPVKPTTFGNWPIQATGADILRLAVIMLVEEGYQVAATVHDAVLIEASLDGIDSATAGARAIMEEASAIVLGGPRVATDATIVRYPERFRDGAGAALWNLIGGFLERGGGDTLAEPEGDT